MFNMIDVIVLITILLSVFLGYKKGFIKTAVNLLSFFVAIALALMFYKPLAVILTENTTIDDWIIDNIVASQEEQKHLEYENAEEVLSENVLESVFTYFPNALTENIALEEIKNSAKEELSYKVSELIMNLLSLIIIYVIVKVTLAVAAFVLNGIMQIPVLKQLNEILGMVLGAILGFIQIYITFAVITFISSLCDISFVIEAIKESAFARILFENNVILNLLF